MKPGLIRRRRRTLGLLAVTAVLAACSGSSGSSNRRPPSTTTSTTLVTSASTGASTTAASTTVPGYATPEDAIRAWLTSMSHQYAGDCGSANPATQAGQWCSLLQQDNGATRTYGVGPVASEVANVLTLTQTSGRWTVTNAIPAPSPT